MKLYRNGFVETKISNLLLHQKQTLAKAEKGRRSKREKRIFAIFENVFFFLFRTFLENQNTFLPHDQLLRENELYTR